MAPPRWHSKLTITQANIYPFWKIHLWGDKLPTRLKLLWGYKHRYVYTCFHGSLSLSLPTSSYPLSFSSLGRLALGTQAWYYEEAQATQRSHGWGFETTVLGWQQPQPLDTWWASPQELSSPPSVSQLHWGKVSKTCPVSVSDPQKPWEVNKWRLMPLSLGIICSTVMDKLHGKIIVNFVRKHQTIFRGNLTILHSDQECMRAPDASPFLTRYLSPSLSNFSLSWGGGVVSHCGIDSDLPDDATPTFDQKYYYPT